MPTAGACSARPTTPSSRPIRTGKARPCSTFCSRPMPGSTAGRSTRPRRRTPSSATTCSATCARSWTGVTRSRTRSRAGRGSRTGRRARPTRLFAHQLGDRLAEAEPLEQRRRVADLVEDAFELGSDLDAGRRQHRLVLRVALRDVDKSFPAGHAHDRIAVTRLILFGLRLRDEKVAAERVEGDRLRLALLVDEVVGAVTAALDHERLLALVAIVRTALVDRVASALAQRRGGVGERKLRLLGLQAARDGEADRRQERQRTVSHGRLPCADEVVFGGGRIRRFGVGRAIPYCTIGGSDEDRINAIPGLPLRGIRASSAD